jgi:cysteine desulfurase family protein
MIYFDNAATSWPKPPGVSQAVLEAINEAGNPGRGAHKSALWSAYKIYDTREKLAKLFNVKEPLRIAFTMNVTHALNIAIHLCMGEIVSTSMEHNSVLRPLASRGFYSIVAADRQGNIDTDKVIRSISNVTGAVVMTHASNVTGNIYDIAKVGEACRKKGVLFIVDAAQTAGVTKIDVDEMNIDILCFTGHKGLFGLQGTGGLYVAPNVPIRPFMCGGTGSRSFEITQPTELPDCFEVGTLNTHGIAGLCAGVDFIQSIGTNVIEQHETRLRSYFINKVKNISGVFIYGDTPGRHVGVVSIIIHGVDCSIFSNFLSKKGICTRSGIHCAPLAHRSLGTEETGTVRFSFGYFNTLDEIDQTIEAIKENKEITSKNMSLL